MTSGRIMQFSAAPLDLLLLMLVSVRRQKARQQGEEKVEGKSNKGKCLERQWKFFDFHVTIENMQGYKLLDITIHAKIIIH